MRALIVAAAVGVVGCGDAQHLDVTASPFVMVDHSPASTPWGGRVGSRAGPLLGFGQRYLALNIDSPRAVLGDVRTTEVLDALELPAGSLPEVASCSELAGQCWVALRARGEVLELQEVRGHLEVVRRLDVGSEPTGIAVSPRGRYVVVATFAERSVAVIDTASGAVAHVDVGGQPRAVSFSNTGDDDSTERAWVTLFFGQAVAGQRQGTVVAVDPVALRVADTITFTSGQACGANQLSAVAEAQGTVYVAFQCTVPDTTLGTGNLDTGLAVLTAATHLVRVSTLRQLSGRAVADPINLFVRATPAGLHQVTILTRGSGFLAQVVLTPSNPSFFVGGLVAPCGLESASSQPGPSQPAGPLPTGPYGSSPPQGGVGAPPCWGTAPAEATSSFLADGSPFGFSTGLRGQFTGFAVGPNGEELLYDRFDHSVVSGIAPLDTPRRVGLDRGQPTAADFLELNGKFRFSSSRDEWASAGAMVSCSSCHPDGLSDGLTWKMPAGPRQTISLDGTFARADATDHRAQGWAATSDEVADVEGLVRGFMGGTGALLYGSLDVPAQIPLQVGFPVGSIAASRHDGLSGSTQELLDKVSVNRDWVTIERWVQHVRTPRAPTLLDAASVARGRGVFVAAGCHTCHGGPRWTVSHVPYVPSTATNGSDRSADGLAPTAPWGLRVEQRTGGALPFQGAVNTDTLKVDVERLPLADGGTQSIGPERITCVLRDVGTFEASNPLEVKADGSRALGALGFNVPSLLGAGSRAAYLHHGGAATLADLLSTRFPRHLSVGNPGFSPAGTDLADLVAFVASIDDSTPVLPVPQGYDICGGS